VLFTRLLLSSFQTQQTADDAPRQGSRGSRGETLEVTTLAASILGSGSYGERYAAAAPLGKPLKLSTLRSQGVAHLAADQVSVRRSYWLETASEITAVDFSERPLHGNLSDEERGRLMPVQRRSQLDPLRTSQFANW
jgi:hypothetical protein